MLPPGGVARDPCVDYHQGYTQQGPKHLKRKACEAGMFFRRVGITFNVYGYADAGERLIPSDIVPRNT